MSVWLRTSLLLCAMAVSAELDRAVTAGYDRPGKNSRQSRSVVVAEHGMVATSQPLAAQAGLDILKRGGNAIDAAIAANAMIGLTEPMSCGIGGDIFVIYYEAKTGKLHGLNGSGRSPYRLNRAVFSERGLTEIPETGPLAWSVPGCVAGWDDLRSRFGTMGFDQTLAPAIEYAEHGFPVSEIIAASWKSAAGSLQRWPDSAATYLPGGKPPDVGERFRNPNLARSLRAIVAGGRDAFYKGSIAEEIVSFSEGNGGYFSLKDFADHQSDWVEPVSTNYRGYDVWELPPNGQGIAVLQMLNLLEPHNLRSMGAGSAEYLHLLVEAKKLAYADRARFYADPHGQRLPVAELISKPYARQRGQLISTERAMTNMPAGDPKLAHGDTIYLTVVDKDRNCCSFIQSNYFGFGSLCVPGKLGFVLALDEKHLNRLEPHKRPFHTIIPAMVTKDGKPWFCFGVMGGDMQPQGHVQVLVNLIDFGMNVQEAGDAARLRHLGSAEPTGAPADPGGGTVTVESGISDEAIAKLQAKGHRVVRAKSGFGGYQGILIDPDHGSLHGGTDPRKDGCAAGY